MVKTADQVLCITNKKSEPGKINDKDTNFQVLSSLKQEIPQNKNVNIKVRNRNFILSCHKSINAISLLSPKSNAIEGTSCREMQFT